MLLLLTAGLEEREQSKRTKCSTIVFDLNHRFGLTGRVIFSETLPTQTWNLQLSAVVNQQHLEHSLGEWCALYYRPYALTSHLHNNDAMLGVKTCRAARTCAGRALALSASQPVRGPGSARRYGMQGLARWLHAWRWRTWQCLVWPPTHGGALLWCHMHMVYSIKEWDPMKW